MQNLHLQPWPPFKRSGTTITQRTSGDTINSTGDIKIPDSKKLYIGTGLDGELYTESDDVVLANATSDKDIVIRGNDGGVTTDIAKFDVSAGQLSGVVKATSGVMEGSAALNDLSDITITSPTTDQIIKYDGAGWVNGAAISVSAGAGVDFFLDDDSITPTGTDNDNKIITLLKAPDTVTAEEVDSIACASSTILYGAYLYDTALGGTTIDAGVWDFETWCGVDNVAGTTVLLTNIMRQRNESATVTITGTGTSRTATASGNTPFAASKIDVGGTIDSDSYLRTPKGLYRITARTSDTEVTITTPTTYVNETTVTLKVWKKLFQVSTGSIENVATSPLYAGLALYDIVSVQPAYTIEATDGLAAMYFGQSDQNRTLYFSHNGTTRYSHFTSPLAVRHNDIASLQGGTTAQYYHLTSAEYTGTGTGNFVRASSPVMVTPTIGAATATSVAIGANTLDTNEWANLDGTDQALATTSNVTHLSLTVGKNGAGGTEASVTLRDGQNPGTTETVTYTKWNSLNDSNGIVKCNGSGAFSAATANTDYVNPAGVQNSTVNYAADSGSNDTYAITLSPAPTSNEVGQRALFYANTANTGAATLNTNSLGALAIVNADGSALADNSILSGHIVDVVCRYGTAASSIDSCSTDDVSISYSATRIGYGQAFTASTAFKLNYITFKGYKSNSPTGNAVAKIYALTGTYGTNAKPTGAALATSDNFDVSTLTGASAEFDCTFSGANQVVLTAGQYVVTLEYSDGVVGTTLNISAANNGAHGGNYSRNDSSVWTGEDTYELYFKLYGFSKVWQLNNSAPVVTAAQVTSLADAIAANGIVKCNGSGDFTAITDSSANWDTGYNHSQDNTQAHSDYLLNNGDDTSSGSLTLEGGGLTLGKNGATAPAAATLTLCDGANPGSTETVTYTKWNSLNDTNGIVKCDGSGAFSVATAGTDYPRARLTFITEFILDGVNQLTGANVMDFVCPYAGYLVAASIKMEGARTAGSVAVEPHKDGVGLTQTGLDLLIDDDPTQKQYATVAYAANVEYAVTAGTSVGFLVTTTAFTPLSNRGYLTLVIELT